MGCDIHFYVEHKVDGVWKQAFFPDAETERDGKYWYHGRNYLLFGLLAGVRNEHATPLSKPRGIPSDLSDGLKEEWLNWDGDGHTPSYFLLSELLKFKDSKSIHTGYVDVTGYRQFLKNGFPDQWRYDIFMGRNKAVVDNAKMGRILNMASFLGDIEYFTEVIWEMPNVQIGKDFWEGLDTLKVLDPNPENIRCVFWFDN